MQAIEFDVLAPELANISGRLDEAAFCCLSARVVVTMLRANEDINVRHRDGLAFG